MTATPYRLMPLADVRSDMVLADVVRDERGNVLLSKGIVLTDTLIASLRRHGIEALAIAAAAQADTPPPDPTVVQARLDHLFRNNERDDHNDWATGILRRYVEDYRLQREVAP
jgi:hypothetical protein